MTTMKLYHISQSRVSGYDTYSDAVVCAQDEDSARNTHPDGQPRRMRNSSWCQPEYVEVVYLGRAAKGINPGVICASYHAG